MIRYCTVNVEKLLLFKIRPQKNEDDEEDYEGDLHIKVFQDGEYITYHFCMDDAGSIDLFLLMLDEEGLEYEIFDDDGNLVEWVDGYEDYDDYDDDDDLYD